MIDRIAQFEYSHPRAFTAISIAVALPVSVAIVGGLWYALWVGINGGAYL